MKDEVIYYGDLRISKKNSQILETISSSPNDDKRYINHMFDAAFPAKDLFTDLFPDTYDKKEIKKRFRAQTVYKIMKSNFNERYVITIAF